MSLEVDKATITVRGRPETLVKVDKIRKLEFGLEIYSKIKPSRRTIISRHQYAPAQLPVAAIYISEHEGKAVETIQKANATIWSELWISRTLPSPR
jgi:hypothetical protein